MLAARVFRRASAIAGRRSFPLADIFEWYEGHDLRTLTNSVIDPHPNATGHEIMSSGMLEFLSSNGLPPSR